MEEHLTKAEHDLGFAWEGLRESLKVANSVEAIVLLSLIRQVDETRIRVEELIGARLVDEKGGRK